MDTKSALRKSLSLNSVIAITAVTVSLCIIYSPIDPEPYHYQEKPPKLEGPLKPNAKLQRFQKLFLNQLDGPESIAIDRAGILYTGTQEGKIWAIQGDKATQLTRTGINDTSCGSSRFMEPACGRPQGMAIHPTLHNHLYVADTYKGLLRVDTNNGDITTVMTEINNVPFKFVNGMDISPTTGLVYFTDSSSKWDRSHYTYEVVETNRLGRLVEYNPWSGASRLLLDDLYLANGVAVSHDGSFVLVAEMSVCKVRRYFLHGDEAGRSEEFISNYPGYPDNIRRSSRGTFYMGSPVSRFQGSSPFGPFMDNVGPYPRIKKLIASVVPFSLYRVFIPRHSIAVEVDGEGKIVRSFHDPEGSVIRGGMSELYEHEGVVYLGHFSFNFLGKVSLEELYKD